MLEVDNLNVFYGESHIIRGVSLTVGKGEILNLLGRNGVGKTTLLKSIIGQLRPRSGEVRFLGERIDCRQPYEVARRGIMYVPQGREIFPLLTVEENLKAAAVCRGRSVPEAVFNYFPFLKERLKQKGGTLSGGEQQMLSIARALAGNPSLLLLDEPTEGIQPSIVRKIREIICIIAEELAISILLVEQNIEFACSVTRKCCIMEKGEIVYTGHIEGSEDATCQKYLLA
jgi:urea transport system ATP-binding protein